MFNKPNTPPLCSSAVNAENKNVKNNMTKISEILKIVDAYWKFDNDQQPLSSWHDKQDCLKAIEALIKPVLANRCRYFARKRNYSKRKQNSCCEISKESFGRK